jgi:DNA-directed RNA polymerase specialized sigma24 family protein
VGKRVTPPVPFSDDLTLADEFSCSYRRRKSSFSDGPIMSDDGQASVTDWLIHLKAGDVGAAQPLWERYFARLVRHARARFIPRGYVDGEDIALSAFDSFCHAVECGRFPQLSDRNDLWGVLLLITSRKISKVIRGEQAEINGGTYGHEGMSAIEKVRGREPSPDFAAEVAETFHALMESLGDDALRHIAIWKMEGFTNEEIAVRMGCSLKTVSNKLKLVRLKLEARELGN